MKKAVFFDIYGTLIDIRTDEGDPWVYHSLSRYLSYHMVKISPDELRQAYFSLAELQLRQSEELHPEVNVYNIFHSIMHKHGAREYTKAVVADICMLFRSLTVRQFGLFPGIYEGLVSICERYKTAIISDAQWVFTEPEISMLGLDQFFHTRILSSKYGFKKPDVRLFEEAMERLKVKPEDAVYIGDNPPKDLVGSKKAGMKCILFRARSNECDGFRADASFSDYSDLERILLELLE